MKIFLNCQPIKGYRPLFKRLENEKDTCIKPGIVRDYTSCPMYDKFDFRKVPTIKG